VRGGLPPNSKHRALVTPAQRGKGNRRKAAEQDKEKAGTNRHVAMSCTLKGIKAKRLKRVFNIDPNAARYRGAEFAVARPG